MGALIPAVAYIRMSSGKQEASPDQQREAVARLEAKHNCKIIREYFDDSISGDATDKRLDFQRMVKDAQENGDFEVILTWDQDRFGRFDPIEAGYWIKPLRDANVRLITAAQGVVDWVDLTGQLIYSVNQIGKAQYLQDLSRNVSRGLRKSAEAGKIVVPCFGYLKVDGHLVIDPKPAALVRRLFDEYLKPGASLRSVCQMLNAEGVTKTPGVPWNTSRLREILTRRKYTGAYTWGEVQKGTYHAATSGGPTARRKKQPRGQADPVILPDYHDAIVDQVTFNKVQTKLVKRRQATSPFKGVRRYLLTGLLRCGHCGSSMAGKQDRQGRGYMCSGYVLGGKARCNCNRVNEAPLVDALVGKIQAELLDPHNLDRLRDALRRQLADRQQARPQDTTGLRKQLAAVRAKIKRGAERCLAAPDAIAGALYAELEKLHAEQERLQVALAVAEAPVSANHGSDEDKVDRAIRKLHGLRDAFSRADPDKLHHLFELTFSRVDLWFDHKPRGKTILSTFRRGLAHINGSEEFSLVRASSHARL